MFSLVFVHNYTLLSVRCTNFLKSCKRCPQKKRLKSTVLDNPVSDIGVSSLEPTQYKRFLPSLKTTAANASAKIKKRVNEFADWLMNYVPPRTKATVSNSIKTIMNLFPKKTIKINLLKKALKNFTKSYEVDIVLKEYCRR